MRSPDENPKARYVAQRDKDRDKQFVVHNLSTLGQRSAKVVVSASALCGVRLFAHEVNQSYLPSAENMSSDVCLQPRPEDKHFFGIQDAALLQLLRPLYGICDAGDYWAATITTHIRQDLGMEPAPGDPALVFKKGAAGIEGPLGIFVDDCLRGGDEAIQKLTEKTVQQFDAKPWQWDEFVFSGATVASSRGDDYCSTLKQRDYITPLKSLPLSATYEQFASARASLACLAHTRPDLCCSINRAAQVSDRTVHPRRIRALNKTMRRATATQIWVLQYTLLQRSSIRAEGVRRRVIYIE